MTHVYVFDIDGTVSDPSHRLYLIKGLEGLHGKDKKTTPHWDTFYAMAKYDPPIMEVVRVARALRHDGARLIFVTGRPERIRKDTLEWLSDQGLHTSTKDLYMRQDDDFRPDDEVKEDILDMLTISKDYIIDMVFEDRQWVVDMWRRKGIRVAQVDKGDF